jgi:uncharacterized protein (DUF608 family)
MKYKVKICGGVDSIQDYWENEIITDDLDELRKKVREENARIIDIQEKEFETVFIVVRKARYYNDFLYVCKTEEKAEKMREDYYKESGDSIELVIYEEMLND